VGRGAEKGFVDVVRDLHWRCVDPPLGRCPVIMASRLLHSLGCISIVSALVVACGSSRGDAGAPAGRSFDPSTLERSCSDDRQCVLIEPVSECSSCCNDAQAIRDTSELQSALMELASSCEVRTVCTMKCFHAAACVNGRCERRITAPDGG
jgi:hypothetical protein